MATVTLKGNPVQLYGDLPDRESKAPYFRLVKSDLSEVTIDDFKGKNLILNIFPSIDTSVCAMSVRKFNEAADKLPDTVVLGISHDLPFALQRHCAAEGLNNIIPLSAFRAPDFGKEYGLLITSGPMKGLLSRAVIGIDKEGKIIYTQLVPEIGNEPDYEKVLAVFK
ncbi:MAG: thiol peroxidase [Candidatus Cloacimonetes bacterium]|nr:thiol peroxidase [Candidatus Cloacimonadota bacterium]